MSTRSTRNRLHALSIFFVVAAATVFAQERPRPQFRSEPLADGLHFAQLAGGNMLVSIGEDGVLLVDSDYGQIVDTLTDGIRELSDKPIRFVINTHWHFDHVGGNKALAKAGATIIAHENVRMRMSSEQFLEGIGRKVPPAPAAGLPTLTYTDRMALHVNGQEVRLIHISDAHTDGDTFVYLPKANVLHVGDTMFNGMYPYIDTRAGGRITGMINAMDRALELANDDTKIIPGHGPLADVNAVRQFRAMLVGVRDCVQALIKQGKSRDEVITAKPTQDFDDDFSQGALAPDQFAGVVYDGLTRE